MFRGELEKQALRLIIESGEQGLLQRDLWQRLDATSREESRIALKLEAKNVIRREREFADGRWTYRLFTKKKPLTIDSILDVPCTFCEDIYRCERGGEISPITCGKLTQWLLSEGKAPEEAPARSIAN